MSTVESQRPSRRERERDRRRAEILDAAGRVFAARGFATATMDDVATESELSKGTLYLYFENKEALFLSLANRALDGVIGAFTAIAEANIAADGASRFRDMLIAYAQNALDNTEKFRVMVGRLASNSQTDVDCAAFDGHRQRVEKVVTFLVQSLEDGQADGSVRPGVLPAAAAAEAWGGLLGVLLLTINFAELNRRFPRPLEKDRLVPGFIDTLVRGLRTT